MTENAEAATEGEITSVEQLDELAVGTALRDHDGRLYERTRDDCGTWTGAYSRVGRDWPDVPTLPARLLSADAATPRAEGEAAAEEALVTLIDEIGAEVGVAPGQPVLVLSQVRGWMAHGRRANAELEELRAHRCAPPAPEVVSGTEAAALPDGTLLVTADQHGRPRIPGGVFKVDDTIKPTTFADEVRFLAYPPSPTTPPALAVGDVVETAADLDRLPVGAVVRPIDGYGVAFKAGDDDAWQVNGAAWTGRQYVSLPARVLDLGDAS